MKDRKLPTGVMFNAYPDSIGSKLQDSVDLLARPELEGAFSNFYVLPTLFNSDLDRGFSVIDYDLNEELVDPADLERLGGLGIQLKVDLVLNHLSVGSPQFQDLLANGTASKFRSFFVDWNDFWREHGSEGPNGRVSPDPEHLDRMFMRKPGLPILDVRFPDGTDRPYWNTFYQEVRYPELSASDLTDLPNIDAEKAGALAELANEAIGAGKWPEGLELGELSDFGPDLRRLVESRRSYLGQMDLDARSELVWDFYDDTLRKLGGYGARLVRLDAIAYLHKEPGQTNFFNEPGTWDYLDRLEGQAEAHGVTLLPEIHSVYGTGLHRELGERGFPVYDFFFPGLVIDALDRGTRRYLGNWIEEIIDTGLETVNMLGCHDGIPVLDLLGDKNDSDAPGGLMPGSELDAVVERILDRGGRVKNLFGPDGTKISYYQVNATFFSALGEDERKLVLARAIQMFMPGLPQVWYLDLFAGTNDYAAADAGLTAGHKEINRTTLTSADVEAGLRRPVVRQQLDLIKLRNRSAAYAGTISLLPSDDHMLCIRWSNGACEAMLEADLRTHAFTVSDVDASGARTILSQD